MRLARENVCPVHRRWDPGWKSNNKQQTTNNNINNNKHKRSDSIFSGGGAGRAIENSDVRGRADRAIEKQIVSGREKLDLMGVRGAQEQIQI